MFTQAAIQRKSVRNYSPLRFSDETKAQIGLAVKKLVPLYDDVLRADLRQVALGHVEYDAFLHVSPPSPLPR